MTKKCLLLVLALASAPATAGYIVTLQEVGSDVVATGSGPIDLTGLTFFIPNGAPAAVVPDRGEIFTGPAVSTPVDTYTGLTGPLSFGGFVLHFADSGSGDTVGISGDPSHGFGSPGFLVVPAGYASGDPLSDTATYLNETFSSLSVTPGTYVWSWGTGPNQNFTLVIEQEASVPAPATLALLGLGLAGLGWSCRRK